MKSKMNVLKAGLLSLALLLLVSAAHAGDQDFVLVNKTGVEINSLYVAPSSSDDWEEDILGQDTLASGDSVTIKFHRTETAAHWDLRVEDSEGNSITWTGFNLFKVEQITLFFNKETGKATAKYE